MKLLSKRHSGQTPINPAAGSRMADPKRINWSLSPIFTGKTAGFCDLIDQCISILVSHSCSR